MVIQVALLESQPMTGECSHGRVHSVRFVQKNKRLATEVEKPDLVQKGLKRDSTLRTLRNGAGRDWKRSFVLLQRKLAERRGVK